MEAKELMVVRKLNADNELLIVKEEWFEDSKPCECYDNYGQQCDCYNSGCYSLENSESDAISDMLSKLYEHFNIEYTQDDLCDDKYEDTKNGDNELLEGISEDDINNFITDWKDKNEIHTEIKAYTFHNGRNFQTIVLESDCCKPNVERVAAEEEKLIIEEYINCSYNKQQSGFTIYDGDKYNFTISAYQEHWWIAEACLKEEE
jgi:hypothetical protein